MKWSDEYEDKMNYDPNKKGRKQPVEDEPALMAQDWFLIVLCAAVLAFVLIATDLSTKEDKAAPEPAASEKTYDENGYERPWYDAPGNSNEIFRKNFGR